MIYATQHSVLLQMEIAWPVIALFNYVSDITNNAEWRSEVVHAEWISRTDNRVGSSYREVCRIDEEELETTVVVSEFIPYQRRTVTVADSVSFTLIFESLSEDRTRMQVKINQPDQESSHLHELFLNDLKKLKNILEEMYC
jgi:hypothetical protein